MFEISVRKQAFTFFVALVVFVLSMFVTVYAYAAPNDGVPKDAQSYTLTWPDGTSKIYDTYDAMLEDYDAYKLLAENLETDEQGKIVLPDAWAESGDIRIEEIEFPNGYTGTKYTDANLSDGQTTIVNEKVPGELKKPFASTGDNAQGVSLLMGVGVILSGAGLLFMKRKRLV